MTVALLTNMGSWAAAIVVAVLTYVLTKRKEREADWRTVKLELYKEYINAVAGIPEGRMTPESEMRYHDACNTIGLVASPGACSCPGIPGGNISRQLSQNRGIAR